MGWSNELGYFAKSTGISNVKVDVDLDHLRSTAASIRNAQKDYTTQHQKIMSIVRELSASWKGIDANEYMKQVSGFEPQLQKLETLIHEYAAFLEYCVSEYGNTDDYVAQMFMKIGK